MGENCEGIKKEMEKKINQYKEYILAKISTEGRLSTEEEDKTFFEQQKK